jgi:hypothetical protein
MACQDVQCITIKYPDTLLVTQAFRRGTHYQVAVYSVHLCALEGGVREA